jgi:hypothetical protein
VAQRLLGSASPLPPRAVRLPPRGDEAAPLMLPYLADDALDEMDEADGPLDLDAIL